MTIGGRPAIPVAVQREFWCAVRSGMVVAEAAESVGVSITVAWRWFRHVGGVMPEPFPAVRTPLGARRLCFQEREEISCRRAAGEGVRAIARALGRSPSTVSRELRRGTVRRKSGYRASVAQTVADQRARRPKTTMLALDDGLREHVQNRLHAKDSPEQISRRLVLLFPDNPSMRVSHETIYQPLRARPRRVATGVGHLPAHRPGAAQDPADHRTARTHQGHGDIAERPPEARGPRGAGALGISMVLSSRLSECRRCRGPGPVLAQQCPQDVDAAAGEGDDGLAVGGASCAFLEVVVAVGAGAHHAGLR